MNRSWKTSLVGIIGVFLIGVSKSPGIPEWLKHTMEQAALAAPSVGLLFARDNNKSSEQVGAGPKSNGVPPQVG